MFGRSSHRDGVTGARGSVAWIPVLTGIVVALGAMVMLSAAVGAALVVMDELPVEGGDPARLGAPGSLALVVGLFLSYMWGGYTAGRMARGKGIRNGLLVAVGALLVALAAAGAANAADLNTNLSVPWTSERLPIEEEVIVDWGVLLGVISLIAMAAGAAFGGQRGVRWHARLEEQAEGERETEQARTETRTETEPSGVRPPGADEPPPEGPPEPTTTATETQRDDESEPPKSYR